MAGVANLFSTSELTQEREEQEEDEGGTLDSLWCNNCDQDMYSSDSDLFSPQSNPWFPEFAETPSPDLTIRERILDLVVSDDEDDRDEDEDGGLSCCNYFKPDQVALALDLFDQSLHNQIKCPASPDAETSSRSAFRAFDIEEGEVGLKYISNMGFELGLDSESVSGGLGKHEGEEDIEEEEEEEEQQQGDEDDGYDDGSEDYDGDGDGDIGSILEETLSWDDSSDFMDEEFFVGHWNFAPASESGESSSAPNVGSLGLIDSCGCSPGENGCSCQNYDPGLFGFRSDLDEDEQFTTDDEDCGSELDNQSNSYGFPLCLEEEFGWEDVRVDEREVLSQTRSFFEECMIINDDEEMSISSEINSELESGNAVSSEEPVRGLDWEVLLQVQDLDISPSDDAIEHDAESHTGDFVFTSEYEVLFGQFVENENLQKGSRPASKSFLDNLQSVFLTQEDYDKNNALCAVCMDNISTEEQAKRLPCLHHYHGHCIMPWLGVRNTCPVCRFELPTDDPDYEHWSAQRDSSPSENSQWRYDFDSFTQ